MREHEHRDIHINPSFSIGECIGHLLLFNDLCDSSDVEDGDFTFHFSFLHESFIKDDLSRLSHLEFPILKFVGLHILLGNQRDSLDLL
jgi:hypothetical protein